MISGIEKIRKLYKQGSVCVCGQRGKGKDLLMSNVAVRSSRYYGNIDYGGNYTPIDLSVMNINNGYDDFIKGTTKRYVYPLDEGADIYLSDIGVYFPSTYNDRLDKSYPYVPYFLALSRQIANASVHWNCQDLGRAWLKFREQSETYILCRGVFKPLLRLGIVVQKVRIYELYDSCIKRVPPYRVPLPSIFSPKEVKNAYELDKARYEQTYGHVEEYLLVYRNKSTYDSRHFKTLLENAPLG